MRIGVLCLFCLAACAAAAPVKVQHREGLVHGFLTLRTLDGNLVADGDLIQNVRGDRVTSRLVFHFKDGSISEEVAVFSQRSTFRLLSDHLVQKGPSFPHPVDMQINGATGEVEVHYTDDGAEKSTREHVKITDGLANGMLLTLLKNLPTHSPDAKFGFVVATPKPRLVTLLVTRAGEEPFRTSTTERKAVHYKMKVDLGGMTAVLASVFGKEPPEQNVWVLEGEAPAFVKSETQLMPNGPIWRIELTSPVWGK